MQRIVSFGRSLGVGLFVGPIGLFLSACLVPESVAGRSFIAKTSLALLQLGLAAGCVQGILVLARSVPPRATAILAGSAATLSIGFFGVLSAFPADPFGTDLPYTSLLAAAAGILATFALALIGAMLQKRPGRTATILLVAGVVLNIAFLTLRASGGIEAPRPVDERETPPGVPFPDEPGDHIVRTLTYGSGNDRHRTEYGPSVALKTRPVDGTPFAPGGWSVARTGYWGFDASSLPINGRVWYPEGKGVFPLVLIVHGMTSMTVRSDAGFAYLGELLASRGYVVASIDETFLNGGGYRYGNFDGSDIDLRGWLLLRHLDAWAAWNREPGNPFRGRIDMDRIALVGHSRGGEAAAAAAAFNNMARYPRNGNVALGRRRGIRALVGLAPSDIIQTPHERSTPDRIEGVDYLLLQGDHDRQAPPVLASRIFQRVRLPGGEPRRFKSLVMIRGGNHSQFNTAWGRYDLSFPRRLLADLSGQMSGRAQRDAVRAMIPAFLDAALKGDSRYRSPFGDARLLRKWLPGIALTTRYEDSSFVPVADFEEDIDPGTATPDDGRIEGDGLSRWEERDVDPHFYSPIGTRSDRVLRIGWPVEPARPPRLRFDLGSRFPALAAESSLLFSIAFPGEVSTPGVTAVLVDRHGTEAALPLADAFPVDPAPRFTLTRLGFLEIPTPLLILQTVRIPVDRFRTAAPRLDPGHLARVEFRFDGKAAGEAMLDDIGFCGK